MAVATCPSPGFAGQDSLIVKRRIGQILRHLEVCVAARSGPDVQLPVHASVFPHVWRVIFIACFVSFTARLPGTFWPSWSSSRRSCCGTDVAPAVFCFCLLSARSARWAFHSQSLFALFFFGVPPRGVPFVAVRRAVGVRWRPAWRLCRARRHSPRTAAASSDLAAIGSFPRSREISRPFSCRLPFTRDSRN